MFKREMYVTFLVVQKAIAQLMPNVKSGINTQLQTAARIRLADRRQITCYIHYSTITQRRSKCHYQK